MITHHQTLQLGFVGLGTMGGPMAHNLLNAGYTLAAYDLNPTAVKACVEAGASEAINATELVQKSTLVLTSLPSSATFVEVAENHFIPHAKPGQIFIDLGTTEGQATRRIASLLQEKGAKLLDAPLSGGAAGAKAGNLHIFVGGNRAVFDQCKAILHVLGDPAHVVYCGPTGAGQTVKGVNQLVMGLGVAAYLEAMAYGVRAGVEPAAMAQAVGGEAGWRSEFAKIAEQVIAGSAESLYVKFPELPYFLAEAQEQGIPLPLTVALFHFLDPEPRQWRDNMERPTVSFWHTLLNREVKPS